MEDQQLLYHRELGFTAELYHSLCMSVKEYKLTDFFLLMFSLCFLCYSVKKKGCGTTIALITNSLVDIAVMVSITCIQS